MTGQSEPTNPGGQEYEVTDARSAADALAGLLDWGDSDDDPKSPQPSDDDAVEDAGDEPDTEADESQPIGEDDEGQGEPETPAIDPPSSWSAEDKAVFATLPPEAQAVVARRESERDRAIQQRMQESADLRKAREADHAALDERRTQYTQNLQNLAAMVLPDLQRFQQLNWAALTPEQHAVARQQYDLLQMRANAVDREMERVREQQTQDDESRRVERFKSEQALLHAAAPELVDAEKGPALSQAVGQYLHDVRGFSTEEIAGSLDHRLFLLAIDAVRGRQVEAARKSAETKRANTPPRVQKPGSPQSARDDSTPNKRHREAMGRLVRSGSAKDAAAIFEQLI